MGLDLEHTVTLGSSRSPLDLFFHGAAGSPLEIGTGLCAPGSCAWPFDVYALPRGLPWVETAYLPGLLAELPAVLDTAPSDTLIMSLDVEPAESLYATAVFVVPDSRGYRLGAGGYVVTAFGGDSPTASCWWARGCAATPRREPCSSTRPRTSNSRATPRSRTRSRPPPGASWLVVEK